MDALFQNKDVVPFSFKKHMWVFNFVMMHLLSLPLFITLAEFDPADQRVRSGMSVRTKMLCDGKTRRNLVDASEVNDLVDVPAARPQC